MKAKPNRREINITKDAVAVFWFLVTCASLIWAGKTTREMTVGLDAPQFILLDQPKAKDRAAGLTAAVAQPHELGLGTLRQSASVDFAAAGELRSEIAALAIQTLLNRNPQGLDGENRRKKLFTGQAENFLAQSLKSEAEQARQQNRHQKVEVSKIEMEPFTGEQWHCQASGQLIRTTIEQEKVRTEVFDVEIVLAWRLNLDLRFNGQFPYVCHTAVVDLVKSVSNL